MRCPQCRTEMQSKRENHRWNASGLPNVVLMGVEIRRCPACGEQTLVIPRLAALQGNPWPSPSRRRVHVRKCRSFRSPWWPTTVSA